MNTRTPWRMLLILALALALALALPARAAGPSLPEIDRYRVLLHVLETGPGPRSLGPLFEAAQALQSAVMTLDESDQAWLERLSDADAEALRGQLRGLRLHRGLDVHAEIDGAAFLQLARRHGGPVDVAFFERYRAAHNEQALPVYLRFTQRMAPCVRYDDPALLEQYADWRAFRAAHPAAYAGFVGQWLADIEDVMVQGTCSCTETQAPVEAALAGFIERFPESPARPAVAVRLQELREHPTRKPVWCP